MSGNGFVIAGDGWVQVTPCGEFPHAGAGVTQVVDREACDRIAAEFAGRRADPNFPGVLVDFDHFSLDTDKSSEAAGWITELEARDTGLWARVRWSDSGLAAVQGGRFRLVSPVFPAPGACEDLGTGRIRPVRLVSVALTNEPNIKGGRPIANRKAEDRGQKTGGGGGEGGTVGSRKPATGNGESLTANGERGGAEALSGKDEPKGNVMSGPGAKRFMWLLGDPPKGPHCGEAQARRRRVLDRICMMDMMREEARRKMKGNASADGGMGNRWSDKARAVSLAVRQAKAEARRKARERAAAAGTEEGGGPKAEDRGQRPDDGHAVTPNAEATGKASDDGGPWMPRILRKWALQGAAGGSGAEAAVGSDRALSRSAAESLRLAKAGRRKKG